MEPSLRHHDCCYGQLSGGKHAIVGQSGESRLDRGDLHVHDDRSSDGSLLLQQSKDRATGNVSVADQIRQAEKQSLDFLPLIAIT